MPEVLAAPPVLPPTGPLGGAGAGPARGTGFVAALRGSLRQPVAGEPAPADQGSDQRDAGEATRGELAATPALTVPWLLLTMSTVDAGATETAAPAQGTAGTAAPAGEGAPGPAGTPVAEPVPLRAPAVANAGQPNGPGSGAGTESLPATDQNGAVPPPTPGPGPTGDLLSQAAGEEILSPAPQERAASAGERGDGWSLAALRQTGEDTGAQPSPDPAAPDHPPHSAIAQHAARGTSTPRDTLGIAHGKAHELAHRSDAQWAVSEEHDGPVPPSLGTPVRAPEGETGRHEGATADPAPAPLPLTGTGSAQGAPGGTDQTPLTPGLSTSRPSGTPLPQVGEGLGVRVGEGATATARSSAVAQVATALALSVRDGVTEVTITLRPPELGEVRARIVAGPDGLVIRLSAEREAVGALLRARAGELQQALAAQQVPVVEVHVLHNPPPSPAAAASDWQGWQEREWLRRGPGQQERQPGRDGAYQEDDGEA